MKNTQALVALLMVVALLGGCRSGSSSTTAPATSVGADSGGGSNSSGDGGSTGGAGSGGGSGSGSGDGSGGGDSLSPEDFFEQRLQAALDSCRRCHVAGGVADVDGGRGLMLSAGGSDDYTRLYSAWQQLGKGVDSSPLLIESSDPLEPHSGGKLWPVGSQPHADMRILLGCWDDPANCSLHTGGELEQPLPLLGSKRGGHLWADYCAGRVDEVGRPQSAVVARGNDAELPRDPRELVVPGISDNRAVVLNAEWRSCQINDNLRPQNCGDYRELHARGELIGRGQGQPGTAHMFSGSGYRAVEFSDPSSYHPEGSPFTISAENYNRIWQFWDGYMMAPEMPTRPDDFDELLAQRYGTVLPEVRNPYPLPGEDPNATGGGSGQLPIAFTQLREPDGKWTGQIGVKFCSFCHDGNLGAEGLGTQYGGAGTVGDFTVAFRDFAAAGAPAFGALSGLVSIANNRGTGAIDQFQIGFLAFNGGNLEELSNDKILFSQAIGNIKSPPWWNMGHRPQKFHGAVLPTDSSRIDMAAYYPTFAGVSGGDSIAWVDSASYPFQIWAESIKSPAYPGPVDTALAEAGAVLFHSKNLWAPELNNPVPAPAEPGNGSCASCHGVYSPRYASDPAFLADPRLEGMAANLASMAVIGTDPVYADAMQSLRNADGSPNVGVDYNPFLACGLGSFADTPNNSSVMLAPPLHGVWASAPYLHNASVPNLWGVLDPSSERPRIWERQSAPAPAGLEGRVVMGFDTDLERAYDHQKLGWKYRELDCVQDFQQTQPLLACNPISPELPTLQDLLGGIYAEVALLWNLPIDDLAGVPFTDRQIENRKVYNTHMYSQGNQGHAFTAVLSDAERRAIIEYLKTL